MDKNLEATWAFNKKISLLQNPGGFSANRSDPKGWTGARVSTGFFLGSKFGIPASFLIQWQDHDESPYTAWPENKNDPLLMNNLEESEAKNIWTVFFWNSLRAGEMPTGIDLLLVDFSLDVGVKNSAKVFQKFSGMLESGIIKLSSIAPLWDHPQILESKSQKEFFQGLIGRLADAQTHFLRGLPDFGQADAWFKRSLKRRVAALELEA